ncbi:MAG: hypothetical protein AAB473_02245 [Patescibacteria group bacterium]
MAERRMIRRDIWQDDDFDRLSMPAKVLYFALIAHTDDEGCFRSDAKYWKRVAFYSQRFGVSKVEKMLDELRKESLIITGESQIGPAGYVVKSREMQTLDKRKAKPSQYYDFLVSQGITPKYGKPDQGNGSEGKAMEAKDGGHGLGFYTS